MKFMVQFRLKPGSRNHVMDAFEVRGPNRNPSVSFRGGWVGTQADLAFVLVESESLAIVEKAAQSWGEHGSYEIHPVTDVEQF